MENATKALLIAAAVLIAILLISLGVGVFSTASEQMGSADLSEYEIQRFNDKFRNYEGTSVTGAEVNSMIDTVFNHNLAQEDNTTCVAITGAVTLGAVNNAAQSPARVNTGNRYSVVATYNTTTKLINSITVTLLP